jgi:hypothetical protein
MVTLNPLFPRTIGAQVSDLHTKLGYLTTPDVKTRLGVTETQEAEMKTAVTVVDETNAKAENKDTRSKIDVLNRIVAIKGAHVVFRRAINICVVNNPVAMQADYVALNVPQRGHRTTLPAPTTYPVVKTDCNTIRRIIIDFRGKPHGVSGAVIRYGILDTPPAGVEELPNSVLDTVSPYTIEFTEAQRGKRVYFCLAWQNTKGQMGPWSEFLSAIVP